MAAHPQGRDGALAGRRGRRAQPARRRPARPAEMLERLDGESRAYSAKIFESIEDERRRIGRELHDETSQSLAASLAQPGPGGEDARRPRRPSAVERIASARHLIQPLPRPDQAPGPRPAPLDARRLRARAGAALVRPVPSRRVRASTVETRPRRRRTGACRARWRPRCIESLRSRSATSSRHSGGDPGPVVARDQVRLRQPCSSATTVVASSPDDVILDTEGRYGVGLLSIKERAELLHGTARITSAPERGTHVHVVVPLEGRPCRGGEGRVTQTGAAHGAAIRVLLVDDHTILREGVRALLAGEREIVVVGEAGDGREALEKVETAAARHRAHGHGHAGHERPRGDHPHQEAPPRGQGPHPEHVRRRRVRAAGHPGRRLGLPAQGDGGGRPRPRHPRGARRVVVPQPGRSPRS